MSTTQIATAATAIATTKTAGFKPSGEVDFYSETGHAEVCGWTSRNGYMSRACILVSAAELQG